MRPATTAGRATPAPQLLAPRGAHGPGLVPLFDHHIHSDLRNADDYELMAVSGVTSALAPCSSSHERRSSGDAFAARFERLIEVETARAAVYGIDLYVGLAVHAADMSDLRSALEGVDELHKRLGHPRVKALGEVSLRHRTSDEVTVLERQLRLAADTGTPVMVETPPPLEAFTAMLPLLAGAIERSGIDPGRVAVMDLDEHKLRLVHGHGGFDGLGGYGLPVSPRTDALFAVRQKVTHREVMRILDSRGPERLMLNTGFHFGSADPLGLGKTVHRLRLGGVPEQTVRALVHGNAAGFFDIPHRIG
ncbi:TatD family hydrolase [Streptomyces olivaceoviridis]|uniref:TatD family hydrolase n=1 Tax=Streptomyces olivaceoviridis TaxID=1921 RepID=UPI00071861ED